jgi:hypothetical protein
LHVDAEVLARAAIGKYGGGLLSVYIPTSGCSIEAVHWKARVMNPIRPEVSS